MQSARVLKNVTASDVQQALRVYASPAKAKASAWFFKTGPRQYGAGDKFIGVTVPEQRKVARQFRDLPLSQIEQLLESPIHEHRLTALLILVDQYQKAVKTLGATRRVKPRELVDFYLEHRQFVNNWDLVDSSAPQILGQWLLQFGLSSSSRIPTSRDTDIKDPVDTTQRHGSRILFRYRANRSGMALEQLARSKSLWYRRIAIVATQAFIKVGQFDETLKIATLLLADREDLIHKATGWMLREVGKRDEIVLRQFLDRHAATMPRTMLRYAIEKLPDFERKRYLTLRRAAA